jgi:hypothetical protein
MSEELLPFSVSEGNMLFISSLAPLAPYERGEGRAKK